MHIFEGILFFKAANNTKTNKPLGCCQLGASKKDGRRQPTLFQIFDDVHIYTVQQQSFLFKKFNSETAV